MQADQIGKNWSWVEQGSIGGVNRQAHYQSYSQHQRYDFGGERQKLRGYVEEQLHGNQAKKNYDILVKFQKQAEERKHRQLHRNRAYYNLEETAEKNSRICTLQSSSINQQQKILGYGSGPRFSLLPADKFKPPIYRYGGGNGFPMGYQAKRNVTSDLNALSKNNSFYPSLNSRGRSLDMNLHEKPAQNNWALGRIKQIASQKRKESFRNHLSKLELRQQKTIEQYESMERKINKMKKYKNILRYLQHQQRG